MYRHNVSNINKDDEKESTTKVTANKLISEYDTECDTVQCNNSNEHIYTGTDSEDDVEFKESYDRKHITDNTDEGFAGNNLIQSNLRTDGNPTNPKNKEEDVTTTKRVLNDEDINKHDDSNINKVTYIKPLVSNML